MDDNGDSRGTYRDDMDSLQFGGMFPLSQISLASGEDLILPKGETREEDTETEREDPIDGTNLHRNPSDCSSNGNQQNNSLHRKPSFLGPGSHYDGGGFQFMSGLSQ